MLTAFVSITLLAGCATPILWRHLGATIVRDETAPSFELVQRYGPADKSAEWGPVESVVRRIDGRTGQVISESRTWGRPEPQPDFVFGWNGEFVLYDYDRAVFVIGRDVLNSPRDKQVAIPSGTRAALLSCYQKPVVGPCSGADVVTLYSVDLRNAVARPVQIPQVADEVAVRGDLIILREKNALTAYSLNGVRLWREPTAGDERLYPDDLALVSPGVQSRVASRLIATTIGSVTSQNSGVIARRADTGAIEWQRQFTGVRPALALSLGPYIVFVGKREYERVVQGQKTTDFEERWWVWDQAGKEITTGTQPSWKSEYALRGGAPATRVGVAFDAGHSILLVGAGLDAALIRNGKVIRRLSDIPGEPLFLADDVLVCRGENSHFAVRLETSP